MMSRHGVITRCPFFFGGPERSFSRSVETWAELQEVLSEEAWTEGPGLRMVEVLMGEEILTGYWRGRGRLDVCTRYGL